MTADRAWLITYLQHLAPELRPDRMAEDPLLCTAAQQARRNGWDPKAMAEAVAQRDKQFFLRIAIASLPVVAWQSYITMVESGPSYSAAAYEYQRADYLFYNTSYARNLSLRDPFEPQKGRASIAELADRFLSNLTLIPVNFGEAVSAKKEFWNQWVHKVLGATSPDFLMYLGPGMLGILVIGGLVLQLARGDVLVPIYVFAYAAAVCLTPWPIQWTRYWAPLAPFLALKLLFDKDWHVRSETALALTRLGDYVIEVFLDALATDDVYVRENICEELERSGYCDRLISNLGGDDGLLRSRSREILKAMHRLGFSTPLRDYGAHSEDRRIRQEVQSLLSDGTGP